MSTSGLQMHMERSMHPCRCTHWHTAHTTPRHTHRFFLSRLESGPESLTSSLKIHVLLMDPSIPRPFAGQGCEILVFFSVSALSSSSPQVHKYQMWTVTEQTKSVRCVPLAVRVAVVSVVAAAACRSTQSTVAIIVMQLHLQLGLRFLTIPSSSKYCDIWWRRQ